MDPIIVALSLFGICLTLALLEVQIEGPHGWAVKLPTWRFDRPWLRKLTNGKPITGYHVYLNMVILAFMHHAVLTAGFSWRLELQIISQYLLVAVYWDFLWFLINPHFGIRRFKQANIWWHRKWTLGMPNDYIVGTAASAAVWLIAGWLYPGPGTGMEVWAMMTGGVIGLTVLTFVVAELAYRVRRAQGAVPAPTQEPEAGPHQ